AACGARRRRMVAGAVERASRRLPPRLRPARRAGVPVMVGNHLELDRRRVAPLQLLVPEPARLAERDSALWLRPPVPARHDLHAATLVLVPAAARVAADPVQGLFQRLARGLLRAVPLSDLPHAGGALHRPVRFSRVYRLGAALELAAVVAAPGVGAAPD